MKRTFVQILSSVLIVAMLLMAVGCYGSFNLINKVYKFNGTLGSKFVNELGFLVMMVIPVYGVAGFVDIVLLNTIEFWTGTNPVTANDGTQTIILPDGKLAVKSSGNSYEFTQVINGQESVVRIEVKDGGVIAKDQAGNILAKSLRNSEGGVTIYDASGSVVSTLTRAQVESMVASK